MQSLMESMSPQMRSELESMMDAAIDPQFMDELAELAGMMYDMFPFDDMAGEYPFMGRRIHDARLRDGAYGRTA